MELATNFWAYVHHNNWAGTDPWTFGSPALDLWKNIDFEENHWNPVFLEEISIYSVLRFMDWNRTNGSRVDKWSDRTLPTATQTAPFSDGDYAITGAEIGGMAYEWLIDLCNRSDADIWLTMPHLTVSSADVNGLASDFVHKLAILLRYGVDMKDVNLKTLPGVEGDLSKLAGLTAAQLVAAGGAYSGHPLESDLKVYVEYSNETWNGSFAAYKYCGGEGLKLSLWKDENGSQYMFNAWASVRVWQAFFDVFGADAPNRVVRVLAGNRVSTWGVQRQYDLIDSANHNPHRHKPDAYAVAAYFYKIGSTQYAGNQTYAKLIDVANASIAEMAAIATILQQRHPGANFITYEGGPHFLSAADQFASRPDAYDIMTYYLEGISQYITLFNQYTHSGTWSGGGAWGALNHTGQSVSEAPKYRALLDWYKQIPGKRPLSPWRYRLLSGIWRDAGFARVDDAAYPFVYISGSGWTYVDPANATTSSLWMYSFSLGVWLWTSDALPGWYFDAGDAANPWKPF